MGAFWPSASIPGGAEDGGTASALVDRLERSSGGSRDLDLALGRALGFIDADEVYTTPDGDRVGRGNRDPWPAWTSSVDLSLRLMERVLPGCRWQMSADDSGDATYWASVRNPPPHISAARYRIVREGKTPATALCAAILRASRDA